MSPYDISGLQWVNHCAAELILGSSQKYIYIFHNFSIQIGAGGWQANLMGALIFYFYFLIPFCFKLIVACKLCVVIYVRGD